MKLRYTLSDGSRVTEKELAIIRDRAREMYCIDKMKCSRIAMALGVTPVAVGKWRNKGKWDAILDKDVIRKERNLLRRLDADLADNSLDKSWVLSMLRALSTDAKSESVKLASVVKIGEDLGMFKDVDGSKDIQDQLVFEAIEPSPEPPTLEEALKGAKTPEKPAEGDSGPTSDTSDTVVLETVTPSQAKASA